MSNQPPPGHRPVSRLQGQQVNVGESFKINGEAEFRKHVESSLEKLAKQRMLEAESRAEHLVDQASQEANRILSEARAEAEAMLRQARNEEEDIRKQAYEEGFQAGFEQGTRDATEQVVQEAVMMIQSAEALIDGACKAQHLVLKNFEKQALQIIQHICQRILGRELQDSPETLLYMLSQAVDSLHMTGRVKVVVSTQTLQTLQAYARENAEALESLKRLELVADAMLELNQVFVIGEEGSFDATPTSQLEQLMTPLHQSLNLPRDTEQAQPSHEDPFEAITEDEEAPGEAL